MRNGEGSISRSLRSNRGYKLEATAKVVAVLYRLSGLLGRFCVCALRPQRRRLSSDGRRWKMVLVWVGSIAQRLEQGTHNPLVEGSNPSGPNLFIAGAVGRPATHTLGTQAIHELWTRGVRKTKKSKVMGRGRE